MNGVTIDRIDQFPKTLAAYDQIPGPRVARLVCDPGMRPIHYADCARRLRSRGRVVLLPVDSTATRGLTCGQYMVRYNTYARAASPNDIVEVNEVNGPWTGLETVMKARVGIEAAQSHDLDSLLTLYLEGTDVASLWRWLDHNYAQVALARHVGISYYPRQSKPNINAWKPVFDELGDRFPRARLLFSEVGTERYGDEDEPIPATPEETRDIISTYCRSKVDHPRFDGGYFYWDFVTDMARGEYLPDLVRSYSRGT